MRHARICSFPDLRGVDSPIAIPEHAMCAVYVGPGVSTMSYGVCLRLRLSTRWITKLNATSPSAAHSTETHSNRKTGNDAVLEPAQDYNSNSVHACLVQELLYQTSKKSQPRTCLELCSIPRVRLWRRVHSHDTVHLHTSGLGYGLPSDSYYVVQVRLPVSDFQITLP